MQVVLHGTHPRLSWRPLLESAGGGFSASLSAPPYYNDLVLVIQRQRGERPGGQEADQQGQPRQQEQEGQQPAGQQGPGLAYAPSHWALLLVDTRAKTVRTLGTCGGLLAGDRFVIVQGQVAQGQLTQGEVTQGEMLQACGELAEGLFTRVYPGGAALLSGCATTSSWRANFRSKPATDRQLDKISGLSSRPSSSSSSSPTRLNMEDASDRISMLLAAEVLLRAKGGGAGAASQEEQAAQKQAQLSERGAPRKPAWEARGRGRW